MIFLPPGVDAFTATLLIVISFFTSAMTAAFGIGGGVAMLGALAGTVPPAVIVAVHGLVQLGSNMVVPSSRKITRTGGFSGCS